VLVLANKVHSGYGLLSVWRGVRRPAADEREMQNEPASVLVRYGGLARSGGLARAIPFNKRCHRDD
jgi:hypothetical protein